ncbi:GNAT family N-acetyltransferase [Arthrobacter globiformis]|uniref:GNAT family N-acetyltransferase n=1 Tax=Arthrobacter globiformis TaxID=1665 RepID=UPI0027815298|nr:GNAT family N-acetyltransferase [Arthrobacter globiformis]MDQ0865521.1 ribosomal protein S18 acetylase RimI-like enzyme [Arthrobacter globiformis]
MDRQTIPGLDVGLDVLMDAAWPAPDRELSGGWVLRAAAGVTQRANSVWPRSEPRGTRDGRLAALREARAWYRGRRLPVIFQVFDTPGSSALNAVLDEEGFTRQSETLIMARAAEVAPAAGGDAPEPGAGVEITGQPSAEWLELWWSVDGRGAAAELETARAILTGCPALYALVRDDDGGPAAVGRLAVVPGGTAGPGAPGSWGGLYCVATRPDARRRGYATRVQQGLFSAGAARGLAGYWLLVMASNTAARELYSRAGFCEVSRYYYRQERPRRSLSGC